MLLSIALSIARRSRGLLGASLPPSFAATVISRIRREKILPRLASVAALRCLMFAHLLWPAMDQSIGVRTRKLYAPQKTTELRIGLGVMCIFRTNGAERREPATRGPRRRSDA